MEDLERFTRMDDLVITGPGTTHRAHARITAGDEEGDDAPGGELHILGQQVIKFFIKEKKIQDPLNKGL